MPLFRAQLFLVGYLVYRSGYIPKIIGALVAIAGLGYVISYLSPFLYPNAYLGFIMVTFFGELIFMLWLLVQGGADQRTNGVIVTGRADKSYHRAM